MALRLKFQLQLPGNVAQHARVRQSRPGDVAAQLFLPLAIMCFAAQGRMQAEAIDLGAKRPARRALARNCCRQAQALVSDARPEVVAVSDGRRLHASSSSASGLEN